MSRRFALIAVALAILPLTGCGYALAGRGSSLPATIRTIGIPLFANATSVFDVEQALTQRVRLEFISRGKFRVVPDESGTDAVLQRRDHRPSPSGRRPSRRNSRPRATRSRSS